MARIVITLFLSIAYIAIGVIATRLIWKAAFLNQGQKIIQTLIVWMLPYAGGILLILLNKKQKPIGIEIDKEPSWKRLVTYDEHGEA